MLSKWQSCCALICLNGMRITSVGKKSNTFFFAIVLWFIWFSSLFRSICASSVKTLVKRYIGAKFLQIYHIWNLRSERDINLPQTCLSLYISILKDKVFRLEPWIEAIPFHVLQPLLRQLFRHFISHSFLKRQDKNNIRHSQRMWPWENEIKIKNLKHWTCKREVMFQILLKIWLF